MRLHQFPLGQTGKSGKVHHKGPDVLRSKQGNKKRQKDFTGYIGQRPYLYHNTG